MSVDDSHQTRTQSSRKMLDDYAAGIREFSDKRLLASYEKSLNLRADDLIEITRAELKRRGLLKD